MKLFLSIFLGVLCLAVLPNSIYAKEKADNQAWATKQFEVLWHSPDLLDRVYEIKDLVLEPSIAAAEKPRIRTWDAYIKKSLSEIAAYYESQGIRAPVLPIKTDANGVKRYVVYAYSFKSGSVADFEKHAAGYYRGECSENKGKLALDVSKRKKLTVSETLSPNLTSFYSTLAHELFHAVQYSYDRKSTSIRWCEEDIGNGRKAVLEGTATAAATLALMNRESNYFQNLYGITDINIGAFPYGGIDEFLKAESTSGEENSDSNALEYKTSSFWRYLAERFGGKKPLSVFDTLLKQKLVSGTIEERYRWLDRAVTNENIASTALYILFPEFQAEFASYVPTRYLASKKDWEQTVYRKKGCHRVKLNHENLFYDEIIFKFPNFIPRNGATCIELEWTGVKRPFRIETEAVHKSKGIVDQLHLGVSSLDTDSKVDRCFTTILGEIAIGNGYREDLECSFGKVFLRNDPNGKHIRTWVLGTPEGEDGAGAGAFFTRKPGENGKATFVLTNMAKIPINTKDIAGTEAEDDMLKLRFSIARTKVVDGREYYPAELTQIRDSFNQMPSIPASFAGSNLLTGNTNKSYSFVESAFTFKRESEIWNSSQNIDRYSIYGIKKPSPVHQGGLGSTFQTVSATDPKKKYSIAPLNPNEFKFGRIGPFSGIVANEANAISTLCKSNMGKPIGEITKSDNEQLRFKISTDLCKAVGNGFKKVDSITAEFIFPFGRRAFPETAPQDVITPGLELYIDEYLKELARRGLQLPPTVLLLDGTHPNDVVSSDPDNPSANPTAPNKKKSNTANAVCDCSCEAFARFNKVAEEAKRDPKKRQAMMSAMRCVQSCIQQWGKCPKN